MEWIPLFSFNKYKKKYIFHFWLLHGFWPKNLAAARKFWFCPSDGAAAPFPHPGSYIRLWCHAPWNCVLLVSWFLLLASNPGDVTGLALSRLSLHPLHRAELLILNWWHTTCVTDNETLTVCSQYSECLRSRFTTEWPCTCSSVTLSVCLSVTQRP